MCPLRHLPLSCIVVFAVGCGRGGTFEREKRAHVEASREMYEVSWGEPMSSAAVEESERAFTCVWDALDRNGANPAQELACSTTRIRAAGKCFRERPDPVVACRDVFESSCPASEKFRSAAAECKTKDAGPSQ
ncbi:MAG: hypothetical protein HOW73_43015 [Polyangiaceae bacterium]|nr:hypothetical protein [Polyangiaceae bacterium]